MNEPFIPLSAALQSRSKRATFQTAAMALAEAPQPLFQAEAGSPGSASQPGHCEPRVLLQRDGERVSGIRIQCACGQIIELACVYPDTLAKV